MTTWKSRICSVSHLILERWTGDGLVLDQVHLQLVHRVLQDGGEVGSIVSVTLVLLRRDGVDLPPGSLKLRQWRVIWKTI